MLDVSICFLPGKSTMWLQRKVTGSFLDLPRFASSVVSIWREQATILTLLTFSEIISGEIFYLHECYYSAWLLPTRNMDCLTINQPPVFHLRSAMQSFKADSFGHIYYCIWVPCFAPVFLSSSSWGLCFFLALPKILLKYLFTAQTK